MMEQSVPPEQSAPPPHHKFRCAGVGSGGCTYTSEKWGVMARHMKGCTAAQSEPVKMRNINKCKMEGYVKMKRDTFRCAGNPSGGCTFTCNDKKEILTHMDKCKAAIGKPRKLKCCLNKYDEGNGKRKQSDDGSAEQDPKKPRPLDSLNSMKKANKTNPILPQTRGFLISYNEDLFHSSHGADTTSFSTGVIDLLNKYADKYYRNSGENLCQFTHRLCDLPPVFIETDMPDPAVLVDALYNELINTEEAVDCVAASSHMKFLSSWTKFTPVHMTCVNTVDEIMRNLKHVITPVFFQQPTPTPLTYRLLIKGKQLGHVVMARMRTEVIDFISSSDVAHTEISSKHKDHKTFIYERRDGEGVPDVEMLVHACVGNKSTIGLLMNHKKNKRYNFKSVLENYKKRTASIRLHKDVEKTFTTEEVLDGDNQGSDVTTNSGETGCIPDPENHKNPGFGEADLEMPENTEKVFFF